MQRQPPTPPIEHYEGLIFTHSRRLLDILERRGGHVEWDLDEIRQHYRIKTWKALEAFDPARCKTTVDKFVFMCLKNHEIDMLKKRQTKDLFLEDVDLSERQVAVSEDMAYAEIKPNYSLVPNTLNGLELRAVVLLYRGYTQKEAARRLGIDNWSMKKIMRSIREKMADWRPSAASDLRIQVPA